MEDLDGVKKEAEGNDAEYKHARWWCGWVGGLGFADDEFDGLVVCFGFEYLVAEAFDESLDVFFCCGVVCGYFYGLAGLHLVYFEAEAEYGFWAVESCAV